MRPGPITAALMAVVTPGTAGGLACDARTLGRSAVVLASAGYTLAYRADPHPIRTGQPLALDVVVCPGPGRPAPERLAVDATMPEHRHGMNYAPTVTSRGPGRFRAEGLLLHMPGRWQFAFEVRAGGNTTLLTGDVVLP